MKKLAKTKFFVLAIFALAILLASCDNAAGGAKNPATDNGQGNNPKSVLDTPQNALKNIPLVSELINEALGKTPSNPSIRAASAFDDVKNGLADYMLDINSNTSSTGEISMAILKFDFSKMNLRFGDVYRIPSDFDFSQETINYFHNIGGDSYYLDRMRNTFRNAVFQIVKYSSTVVYVYCKPNGMGIGLFKLSENITGILDTEFLLPDESNFALSWYERLVESNGKKIYDTYNLPVGNIENVRRISAKSIIDNINSYCASFNSDNLKVFRNKSVYGNSKPSLARYATSDGKILLEKRFWDNWKNSFFLKYLTPIKADLKLDGDTWKWGDGTLAEIKSTNNRDGRKCYYVEEADLEGNCSVPASTRNIITTLDAKFAEMETDASRPGFFLTEIPNEADWKKRLDDWLAICESAE